MSRWLTGVGCCGRNETPEHVVLHALHQIERGALAKAVEQIAENRVRLLLDAKANVNETDKVAAMLPSPV